MNRSSVVIRDNGGEVSVMSNIENILAEISKQKFINLEKWIIVYRDGELWDGYDFRLKVHVLVSVEDWRDAVKWMVAKKNIMQQ